MRFVMPVAGWIVATAAGPTASAGEPASQPATAPAAATLRFEIPADLRMELGGFLGGRVDLNLRQWLLAAPDANPGMLEMFRARQRGTPWELAPGAGGYLGEYLVAAIQTTRMTESPELEATVRRLVGELISTQDDDGYLGVAPPDQRFANDRQVWAQARILDVLLRYHRLTGDEAALRSAERAADLLVDWYGRTPPPALTPPPPGHGPLTAAPPEPRGLSVMRPLAALYHLTGKKSFLAALAGMDAEWEQAGDYRYDAMQAADFFRSRCPHFTSLPVLGGLTELYRITGDRMCREAFNNAWESVQQYDATVTGGFGSAGVAIGAPYRPGELNTQATVAWMEMTADRLRLEGDPLAADELEIATFNALLGAQHPSGRWWAHSAGIEGTRAACGQVEPPPVRAGLAEISPCGLAGPRGLGLLAEWALLVDGSGPVLNAYGPARMSCVLPGGLRLVLTQETDYPVGGRVKLRVEPAGAARFNLRLRIPAWSAGTQARINGQPYAAPIEPGGYLALERDWNPGDEITLDLDMAPRYVSGQREQTGRAALFAGPLLLAADEVHNPGGLDALGEVELRNLRLSPVEADARFRPQVLFEVPRDGGTTLRLCDFATAGAAGSRYRVWLPARHAGPPPFRLKYPRDGAEIPFGTARLEWTGFASSDPEGVIYELRVSDRPDFSRIVFRRAGLVQNRCISPAGFPPGVTHYWKVIARNRWGELTNVGGPHSFKVSSLPPPADQPALCLPMEGPENILAAAPLEGRADLACATAVESHGIRPAPDRTGGSGGAVAFNGRDTFIRFPLDLFPEDDYTLRMWVYAARAAAAPQAIFSARGQADDVALELILRDGALTALVLQGQAVETSPVPMPAHQWTHVAVTKSGEALVLHLDGELKASATVPEYVHSAARRVVLGARALPEDAAWFDGRLDQFVLQGKALGVAELRAAMASSGLR